MEIDSVFEDMIGYGSYQRKIVWVIGLTNVFQAFHNLHNVYLGAQPKFVCVQKEQEIDYCPTDSSKCDSIKFPGDDFTSIVSEWGLVCDQAYKAQLVQSAFMMGIMIGSLVCGIVADRFGRKQLTCGSVIWMGIFTMLGAWTNDYASYAVIRCIVGMGGGTLGMVSFVLITELLNQSERSFVGTLYPMIFAVGIAIFSGLAAFVHDWRLLTVCTALPSLIGFYMYRLLPESPRWLYSMKRKDEAESVLLRIVVKNTGYPPKEEIVLKDNINIASFVKSPPEQLSIVGIFMHPILRGWTIISAFTWFSCCAVYYGLTFGAGNLGSNMYVSVSLAGLVEIPACFLTWYLMERIGRRLVYSGSMLLGGVMCVCILVLPAGYPNTKIALALLGKLSISISFCVAWVYTTEFYPTTIRNKGLSISNMAARFGGVLSPMILAIGTAHQSMDFLIFGVLSFLAAVAALRLPETAKKPLPESLNDLNLLFS